MKKDFHPQCLKTCLALILILHTILPILTAQNVGIGTVTPGAKLMVVGNGNTDASATLNVVNSESQSLLHVKDDGKIGIGTTSPGAKLMVVGTGTTNATAATNIVNSMSMPLFHIKDDGRTGIGTSNPGARLMINGLGNTSSTFTLNVANNNNTSLFSVRDDGRVGVGVLSPGARFMVKGEGMTDASAAMNIVNSMNNSLLHIKDDGKIGVGTTSPGAKFMVVGNGMTNSTAAVNIVNSESMSLFHIKDNGDIGLGTTSPSQRLQIGTMGDGTVAIANAWNTFSDRRYKQNIRRIDNALSMTKALEGVRFDWKSTGTPSMGFIAQELESILPELVSTDTNGFKSIDYPKVVALLVEAIKEQQETIEIQKQHFSELIVKVENIQTVLQRLADDSKNKNVKKNSRIGE